jgi:hypothetical protein
MGARAVFRIYSEDHDGAFWTGWGSPEFKVSTLAHWIEACRWRNQIPSAANYWEHAQIDPDGGHFTEAIAIDAPYPSDLNFRYELVATKALSGWGADLTIWSNLRPGGGFTEEYHQLHRLSVSNLHTAPIHALAAVGLRTLVNRSFSHQNRYGQSGETLDAWELQATIHAAYAGTDGAGIVVSPAALSGLAVAK